MLVASGGRKVLFDALYSYSFDRYALVPTETQAAMLAGEAPFDGIDAVLVSHVHGDHFSREPALRFLHANREALLFGTPQIADALREAGADSQVMDRVIVFDIKPDDKAETFTAGGLAVSAAAIPHSGGERMAHIQNLSFRVTLDDGVSAVHIDRKSVV